MISRYCLLALATGLQCAPAWATLHSPAAGNTGAKDSPLYPFGYGLSYTDFSLSEITLSSRQLKVDQTLYASIAVKNTGARDGETVVQLYLQDVSASVSRPVKELNGFKKIMLKAGEERTVRFAVSKHDLKFYNARLHYAAEPGEFNLQIGLDSQNVKQQRFEWQ